MRNSSFGLAGTGVALFSAGVIAVLACSGDGSGPDTRTLRGADIAVGGGLAHSEMVVDGDNAIQSIRVVFNEAALTNLPGTLPNTEFIVPLPTGAPATVFNHIGINWQPNGHPPPMVYTLPHFDVHFYLISTQERDAISPADPTFGAKATKAPTTEEIVPRYVADPFAIPRMGTHWTDQDSHEFHGQPFTSTIVYGFYDGKMIFLEPMMTKAFLDSKPDQTKPLRVPTKYPKAGRYPSSYRVAFDNTAKEYRVEMLEFVARQ
jgi:hypothetical protein